MPVCSFCKKSFNAPRGLTVFQFDGKAVHFCSSKCIKNTALGRDGRKTNWVRRIKKGGEVVNKSTAIKGEEAAVAQKIEKTEKVEEKK
jgi:ribosomal protein L24E